MKADFDVWRWPDVTPHPLAVASVYGGRAEATDLWLARLTRDGPEQAQHPDLRLKSSARPNCFGSIVGKDDSYLSQGTSSAAISLRTRPFKEVSACPAEHLVGLFDEPRS
jgi:hypothetical protein